MKDHHLFINAAAAVFLVTAPLITQAGTTEPTATTELRTSFNLSFPNANDNWDDGFGFQAQAIMAPEFLSPGYLLGLSLGVSNWDVNSDTVTLAGSNAESANLSGEASLTELGISVMRRKALPNNMAATFETGLLYQIFSSDAELTFTYPTTSTTTEMDFDNSLALLLGADLSTEISDKLMIFFGAALQFDLAQGDATFQDQEVENETGTLKIRSGIEFKF